MADKYEVCVIESEAGWGQKREYKIFDTVEAAIEFRDHINSFNKPMKDGEITPNWYMIAEQDILMIEQK